MNSVVTKVPEQTIMVIKDVYDLDRSKEIAIHNKSWAFGIMHGVKSIFTDQGNIVIGRVEKQYYPFWHIAAENYQEYIKRNHYSFNVAPEVREVSVFGNKVPIENEPVCHITTDDRCVEHAEKEVIVDASTRKSKDLKTYLTFESKKLKQTEDLMKKNEVVVPAEIRANFLIRELFKELIRPIHADKIIEERVAITKLILYFRPVYCIELVNDKTQAAAVVEVDAVNGAFSKGQIFGKEIKEMIDEGLLFDIGAEIAGAIIPGASLGALVGKEVKRRYSKSKVKKQMEKSKSAYETKGTKKRAKK